MYRFFQFTFILFFFYLSVFAQDYTIRGSISDENENPLPGATILLKNSSKGTISDATGKFVINGLTSAKVTLSISYVGYRNVEVEASLPTNEPLDVSLATETLTGKEVIIYAQRTYPVTKTIVTSKELEKQNLGQDIPQLLNFTPSVVTTSDAGAGVGYTGIRIRGSDPQRINVTINGIPLNDSESHGVFWVNMPDFASTVSDITIQRGVGTSVNGAGAFGASVNMNTQIPTEDTYVTIDNSIGSFNTRRHNIELNTGEIGNGFRFYGRLSKIDSDGFVDRASADMSSYYLSGSYRTAKSNITFNAFSGSEITQQAWWGVPEARLNNDIEGMQQYIANNGLTDAQANNLLNSDGRTYNYYIYDNEIDNYGQDHYQLLFNTKLDNQWQLNTALHYTRGQGYFEQAGYGKDLADFLLSYPVIGTDTVQNSDIVVQRWLDNHFFGGIASINYQSKEKIGNTAKLDLIAGGGWNRYVGDHFGDVIWARLLPNDAETNQRYYFSDAVKTDANFYGKASYQLLEGLFLFADMQVRQVSYRTEGTDNDNRTIDVDDNLFFFNPKFGASYFWGNNELYASFAIANKEPIRGDYIDAIPGVTPEHETLRNLELGYARNATNVSWAINYYLMDYKNQLIPTGEVNDVGAAVRTNIPSSYRTGIELQTQIRFNDNFNWMANTTLSRNINRNFTEQVINFADFTYIRNDLGDTDIALSPNVVVGSQLAYKPFKGAEVALLSKYVGQQFLDNTSSDDRTLPSYFTNDLRVSYLLQPSFVKEIGIDLLVNNILNEQYEANGYTYAYAIGDFTVREDHFFPQAGTNFLLRLRVKI